MTMPTDRFLHCNHHHELTPDHEIVDFGHGTFVANKKAIPLLKALSDLGLFTRSHHIDNEQAWITILLDNVNLEIKTVFEADATRTQFNGKKELVISWKK